jgi:hypothetical protein
LGTPKPPGLIVATPVPAVVQKPREGVLKGGEKELGFKYYCKKTDKQDPTKCYFGTLLSTGRWMESLELDEEQKHASFEHEISCFLPERQKSVAVVPEGYTPP